MSDRPQLNYTIDPSTNPATWPGPIPTSSYIDICKVDVIYVNINAASDFTLLRTGTNELIQHAVIQVTKHLARGLYRIISMNVSEYSCVVVMSTEKREVSSCGRTAFRGIMKRIRNRRSC